MEGFNGGVLATLGGWRIELTSTVTPFLGCNQKQWFKRVFCLVELLGNYSFWLNQKAANAN